jgi:hypothetical protein
MSYFAEPVSAINKPERGIDRRVREIAGIRARRVDICFCKARPVEMTRHSK